MKLRTSMLGGLMVLAWSQALAGVLPSQVAAQERADNAPKNLQFFPEDMPRSEVVGMMRQFSFALGVRCQYCHVGGDGVSFEGVVFESDESPNKRKARFMLQMVETINTSMLPMMADRDDPGYELTCKSCHRGQAKPALLTDVLRQTLDEEGPDSAVVQYHNLREQAGLAGMFDFREWEMNTLGEELTVEGRNEDAIAIYELNSEFYPNSVSIVLSLADLYERVGDTEKAIGYYERSLELAPGNRTALARLDVLRGEP